MGTNLHTDIMYNSVTVCHSVTCNTALMLFAKGVPEVCKLVLYLGYYWWKTLDKTKIFSNKQLIVVRTHQEFLTTLQNKSTPGSITVGRWQVKNKEQPIPSFSLISSNSSSNQCIQLHQNSTDNVYRTPSLYLMILWHSVVSLSRLRALNVTVSRQV